MPSAVPGDDNLQQWVVATTSAMTGLALLSVVLRLLSRYERKQKLWWDDWMIVFSMAWNLVVVAFIFAMVHYGMGQHAKDIGMANVVMIAKLLLAAEILYVFNLVWTKLSLLMFYYRIFHFPHFKKWAYVIGTFVIIWVICITFLFVFICVPVQKIWNPSIPGRCINQVGTWIANAASTILTDLIILILPIPQVWRLQLRRSEKIALSFAFGLGTFVIFASAYRFTVLFSYTPADSSYTLAPTVGWTAIEMSAGITSACLPTLRPALQFLARNLGISSSLPIFLRNKSSLGYTGAEPSKHSILTSSNGGTGTGTGRDSLAHHPRRMSLQQHAFKRLPDETTGGFAGSSPPSDHQLPDATLRPDHGYVYTVTTGPGSGKDESASLSGDDVPLHHIRVQKDFEQFEN